MGILKKKIAKFFLLLLFFLGLITFAYSQEPKSCQFSGNWIDPHGFTATCNVPDCHEAMSRINKWVSLTLILLTAYLAGLRAKGGLNIEAALFRFGVYLTFISVIMVSELSKVAEGICLAIKPAAYVVAAIGSFLVAWFHGE